MDMKKDTIKKIIYTVLCVLIIWLIIKYALKWIAPFLLALLTARLMERSVKALMERLRLRRGVASAICSIIILAALGAVLALVVTRLVAYLGDFFSNLPDMLEDIGTFINGIREAADGSLGSGAEAQDMEKAILDSLYSMLEGIPQRVSNWALSAASKVAATAPKYFMFIFTYVISVFFFSGSYPDVSRFIMRQIPPRWHRKFMGIKGDFLNTLGKWFKAQFMMMGVTFVELAISFTVLRIPYGLLIAVAVSLIDALPVLGTGTILIPWALISLIGGKTTLAIGLALTYGVVSLVRSIIEPRLVGGQMGLPPVATLIAIYIGFCTIGVWGMIFFPIGLMMLKQLNDNEYIRLWK